MPHLAQLPPDVRALLDRAAVGRARPRDAVAAAVQAVFPDSDDRTRAVVAAGFRSACTTLERAIAERVTPVAETLAAAGTLRIGGLGDELLARARLDRIADALPFDAGADAASPSLLVRLAHSSDTAVARAAGGLLAAESRRQSDGGVGIDLPAAQHAMLAWRVAAALRREGDDAFDRVLADNVARAIAALDDGARVETTAMRLVTLIDARPDELPALIGEALSDRRPALLAALLAHALGVTYEAARGLLTEPADARLGLALRALDLPRETIARTGLLLVETDPAGDVDGFGETLDALMRLPAAVAAAAIAPLALPPEYRAAIAAIERAR
ncbi:DUF2336 domain-containing protein [Sphingomonas sp. RS2018]